MIRRIGSTVLDAVFPIECLGCGKEKEWLCRRCAAAIPLEAQDLCFVCKEQSLGGRTCFSCRRKFSLAGVVRLLNYDWPLVREALRVAKYGYVAAVFPPLLEALTPHLAPKLDMLDIDPRAAIFAPVPLHHRRLRERGFNQASLVAQAMALACGASCFDMLARRQAVPPQAKLDEEDRIRNVKGNFVCIDREAVRGRYVFVVDDVATTGTTLHECGKALRDAEVREVWGLVLAKG